MKEKLTFEERFDKLMSSIEESNEKSNKEHEKVMKAHEKAMKEIAEIRAMQKENEMESKKLRDSIKETNRNINGISSSNGYIVEDAIYTAVKKDMTFADVEFYDVFRNLNKHKKTINKKGEYDIVLVNCELLAILEAKYKVNEEDVEKLATSQIEKFRLLFPEYQNHKIILGIGGMGFEGDSFDKAKQLGIIPIRVFGEDIEYNTEGMKMF